MPKSSWEDRLNEVVEKNILKYVESFSEEKAVPAFEKLLDDIESGKKDIKDFDDMVDSMYEKFDAMSDVQAGKLWTDSQIEVGSEKGYKEFVIISEGDSLVCQFCEEMDGQVIYVEAATKSIESGEEQEFIGVDDLEDIEDVEGSGLRPPLHLSCR